MTSSASPRKVFYEALALASINLLFALILIWQVAGPLHSPTELENSYLANSQALLEQTELQFPAPRQQIGLSIYLLPFYMIGQGLGATLFWSRFGMALLYAALMASLYLLGRELEISRTAAIMAWAIISFSMPLALSSYGIYPGLAAGLIMLNAVRITQKWDGLSPVNPLLVGLLAALLPWFGTEFLLPALLLLTGITAEIFHRRAPFFKSIGYLLILPLVLGTSFFLLANPWTLELNSISTSARMLLAFFVDQSEGIIFYSPFYLLAIIGIAKWPRVTPLPGNLISIFIFSAIASAMLTQSPGETPVAGALLPVIWILALGLMRILEQIEILSMRLFIIGSAGVSACFTLLFLFHNHLAYMLPGVDGNNLLASLIFPFDATALFPNLLDAADIHAWPTIIITSAIIVTILLLQRQTEFPRSPQLGDIKEIQHYLLVALLPITLFISAYLFLEPADPGTMTVSGNIGMINNSSEILDIEQIEYGGNSYPGFVYKGGFSAGISIVERAEPIRLNIFLYSGTKQSVKLRVNGRLFSFNIEEGSWQQLPVPVELGQRWRGSRIYKLKLTSENSCKVAIDIPNKETR
jgi:hypothetical protein